jgi:hypothetical protein
MHAVIPCFLVVLLLSCPYSSRAQDTSFNPSSTWATRLQVTPTALYLPASKQKVRRAITYVLIADKRLLLEELHYDQQGLLDTSKQYTLAHDERGTIEALLQTRRSYHTRRLGDSLVSEVEEDYGPGTPVRKIRLSGSILIGEPLLGEGSQAHQLLGSATVSAGTFHDDTWRSWSWSYNSQAQQAVFQHIAHYSTHEHSGWSTEVDLAKRRLVTYLRGSRGGVTTYSRQYEGHSQNYTEKCHESWISGGGGSSTEQDSYSRTVYWRKGLCRTEHFVVLGYLTASGTCAEFDVYHQYTFY